MAKTEVPHQSLQVGYYSHLGVWRRLLSGQFPPDSPLNRHHSVRFVQLKLSNQFPG